MNNVFFENEYCIIHLENDGKLVRFTYKKDVNYESMKDQDFRNCLLSYVKVYDTIKPQYKILDKQHCQFAITPDVQDWVKKIIFKRAKPLKKSAIVLGDDIFSKVSTKQLYEVDDIVMPQIEIKYFNNLIQAENWIYTHIY